MSSTKPPKLVAPLSQARGCIKRGRYTATYHAKGRQVERLVPLPDVLFAFENGHHEKSRDRFDPLHGAWSYSVRGRATDRRDLRVVISFDEENELLIITVVVLGGKAK